MNCARWLLPFITLSSLANGAVVQGRFTAGGYFATERFSSMDGGSDKNDYEIFSARAYLKVSEIQNKNWEFVADLRDKDDFFDKADRERLQLTGSNNLQVRELETNYTKMANSYEVGRFPVQEAGAAGVDGGMYERHHTRDWTSGVFGGFNPKREDQTYYQFNSKDEIAGVMNTYQSRGSDWNRNFYVTHALVDELHGSETDRTYLFHNMIYQWNPTSRVISLMYLDFVPRTYIQNGNLTWQEGWNRAWSSQFSLLGVDVITYSRTQGLRETLAPSPYKEGSLRLDYSSTPLNKLEFGFSDGVRDVDHLTKAEYYLGWERNQIWSRHWDLFGKLGGRKNFTSNDTFANVNLGYFSRKWESALDLEYAIERYTDGVTKHPLTAEADVSWYISRALYLTGSYQRAKDEVVTINTFFLRLGYRFGTADQPPLRDGSPPRGSL